MKTTLLLALLIGLTLQEAIAQKQYVVAERVTGKAIPFTNIWVKGKRVGTSSNLNGAFSLNIDPTDSLRLSAIGYQTTTLAATQVQDTVFLKPAIVILRELEISPPDKEKIQQLGSFKKSEINFYFGCGRHPWIAARFFPYLSAYQKTPFLSRLTLLTDSQIKGARLHLRLYAADKDGKPGAALHDENILLRVPKGKKKIEVGLIDRAIRFPESGLFVAVEWLIIEDNKYQYMAYTDLARKKKQSMVSYEPKVGTLPRQTNANSWLLDKGQWNKIWSIGNKVRSFQGEYQELALILELSD